MRAVNGLGPKTFEQAAGFLRIRDGDDPLDVTGVHPESYEVVRHIADSLSVSVADLITTPHLLDPLQLATFQTGSAGVYTLRDIREELRKPGRDPRSQFTVPRFQSGIQQISDLTAGMVLEGAVTNVTNFGAFVDVGVHQDGLVHVSELSTRFIRDPNEAVKVGQVVRVQVLSADAKSKRIALSIKALQSPEALKVKGAPQAPALLNPKTPGLQDRLATLSSRFRTR